MKKTFAILLAALFMAAGCNTSQQNVSVQPNTATSNAQTPAPDPTSGWKDYKDLKYGFEFKYPQNFTINSNSYGHNPTFSDQQNNHFYVAPNFLDKNGKINDVIDNPNLKPSTTEEINGYTWNKYSNLGGYYLSYFIKNGNLTIRFSELDNSQAQTLKSILNTFSFLNLPYQRIDMALSQLAFGDKFGNLSVKKIAYNSPDDASVDFTGEVSLSAHYTLVSDIEGELVCLDHINKADLDLIPQLDHSFDYGTATICMNYNQLAQQQFKNEEGNADITIKNLTESFDKQSITFQAQLVTVK